MTLKQSTVNQLRCFCGHKTLLAVYGLNEQGELYVHVKVFKQDRIFGEIIVTEGKIKLHCRDCLRWHKVRIVQPGKPVLEETSDPAEIAATG